MSPLIPLSPLIDICHLLHRPAPQLYLHSLFDVSLVVPTLVWSSPTPGPVCAGRGFHPAADGQVDMYVRVCDWVRGLDRLSFRLSCCLLRPSAPALPCLGFITGAGGLPQRLVFSCMCAARDPDVSAWVPCPSVWVWCLDGTGCGVM